MSDAPDNLPQDQLPEPLHNALTGMYSRQIPVPSAIDELILSSARANYARRSRRWLWAGRAAIATAGIAATLFFAIRLSVTRTSPGPAASLQARAIVGDINGDGHVDILDAFTLAQKLHDGAKLDPAWDFNGDGKIDEKDVDWLAQQAVHVEGRVQ